MSQRVNVMFSDELNAKLNLYSERYGVSKSMICGFVVGQWLDQMERVNGAVYGTTGNDGFLGEVFKEVLKEAKSE